MGRSCGDLDPIAGVGGRGRNAGLGLPGLDLLGSPVSPRPIAALPGVSGPECGGGGTLLPNRCGVYGVCGVYGDEIKAGVEVGVLL